MATPADYYPSPDSTGERLACPRCGNDLVRMRRRLIDRLLGLFAPTRRYRCREHNCRWEGTIRVAESDPTD